MKESVVQHFKTYIELSLLYRRQKVNITTLKKSQFHSEQDRKATEAQGVTGCGSTGN